MQSERRLRLAVGPRGPIPQATLRHRVGRVRRLLAMAGATVLEAWGSIGALEQTLLCWGSGVGSASLRKVVALADAAFPSAIMPVAKFGRFRA